MTTTSPIPVTTAGFEDGAMIGRVLADAFFDDPVGHWLDPEPATRAGRLSRVFELWATAFTLPHGEVVRAGDFGAALWLPPGRWQVPPLVQLRHLPRLGRIFGRRTALLLRGQKKLERHHPREPHWYLPLIGVAAADQGRGVGSALLGVVLERCDRDGVAAYLEATCERNRDLYARHGFTLRGEVIHLPDGPPLWPMWREPRQVGR